MKIDRFELIHVRLPLRHAQETSLGTVYDHEGLIIRISSDGITGWGEVPAPATPHYSYETVKTAWDVTREFLARKLKGQEIAGPGPIAELFSHVRGHNMAKAGIEMAILDLFGRIQDKPVWEILGGDRQDVATGASFGFEDNEVKLLNKVEKAVAKGVKRIRVRIRPRRDDETLAAGESAAARAATASEPRWR